MRELYRGDSVPRYLNGGARQVLREGRDTYRRFQLDHHRLIQQGPDVLLFPWVGTRIMNTLRVWLAGHQLTVEDQGVLLVVRKTKTGDVLQALASLAEGSVPRGEQLASIVENLSQEKYDSYLTDELAQANYARRRLDPVGAHTWAQRFAAEVE